VSKLDSEDPNMGWTRKKIRIKVERSIKLDEVWTEFRMIHYRGN